MELQKIARKKYWNFWKNMAPIRVALRGLFIPLARNDNLIIIYPGGTRYVYGGVYYAGRTPSRVL